MSDIIATLPTDKDAVVNSAELQAAKLLLSGESPKIKENLKTAVREGLAVLIIVLVLSLPFVDSLLRKVQLLSSEYTLSIAKAIVAFITFVLLKILYFK